MQYQTHYQGTIWTKHALERLAERNIKQGDAWAAWRHPDSSRYSKSRGGWVYLRRWGREEIEVVAKQNENKEWLILSVWAKTLPPQTSQPKANKPNLLKRLITRLIS